MPRPPRALPPEVGEIFDRSDAIAAGLSLGRLRRADLDRAVRGIRAPRGASDDFPTHCRMLQRRLGPDTFFSDATAAHLIGAPLPPWFPLLPFHVTVPAPARAPHAMTIAGHSKRVLPGDVTATGGIRHSSPERLWCELAGRLLLVDLVAVGDWMLRNRMTSRPALAERATAGDRITRGANLRSALPLLDEGAESPPESRLRVLLTLGGIPAPEVNRTMVMTDGGGRIRPDFRFPAARLVIEYQGDYHRSREQWRADMSRRSRLEASGWRVLEVNADDLANPVELCARIRRLLARSPT